MTSQLVPAVDLVKRCFVQVLQHPGIVDVAFVGNSSGLYPWEPTPIVDFDVCVFVHELGGVAGDSLLTLRDELSEELAARDIAFELRIVRGPYKRALESVERPVIVAHLAVYTEESYVNTAAPFLRWGWRKYQCLRDADRLQRLAPERPTLTDLLEARGGVLQRLETITTGRLSMVERILPDMREEVLVVGSDEPLFAEVCFAAGATCSRNHGRALGFDEADQLENRAYFSWYLATVFASDEFEQLMSLKLHARQHGYRNVAAGARRLAIGYLSALATRLSRRAP